MALTFYDLKGRDGLRFSPFGWRVRMALAHKGQEATDVAVGFTEKDRIAFSGQGLVPVLVDHGNGGKVVSDSWAILTYLDDAYPARPLAVGPQARALSRFVGNWVGTTLLPGVAELIIADLFRRVRPEDQRYFRESREKRFGRTLEQVQNGREERLPAFRARLDPLRILMAHQPYICGGSPGLADYLVFGAFQWARLASDFPLLAADDRLRDWQERMLDLHDGLGRRAVTGPTD